uniref:ATP synthase complex subunit 8 n=1 Tax=Nargus velox TaxID=290668 RepID=S4SVE7_NARVE|nr:ATP synthase F0 subunit 8 [Nargus velox]ALO70737.1 ATP synthase F0 subunit 8 [Nargus velox]
MPQMAPMNWLILFFLFTMIFMIFNSLNYFSFYYQTKFFFNNLNFKKNNWKW